MRREMRQALKVCDGRAMKDARVGLATAKV
jgi:hypothetical protein